MDRTTFEALRDLPGKRILSDINFAKRRNTAPLLTAEDIRIENASGIDLRMNLSYNSEVGSKTLNVYVLGTGPICRVDVDGPPHRPAGPCHKHSLKVADCPRRNLPESVQDKPELTGKKMQELFVQFCETANIVHEGEFRDPE